MGTLLIGDCREQLATLPNQSVHCCVTSPPYWGLRDYGVDGQLGLEPTPEVYVANMVAVFREVWRVLRDDGCVWLNLGSTFASGARTSYDTDAKHTGRGGTFRPGAGRADGVVDERAQRNRDGVPTPPGYKPKDLVPIPWLVAMALQADGWYLRSDIIWSKPNPMPESVTDRPTCAHEYVFLLTKRERYFWDAEAVKEKSITGDNRKPYGSDGAWAMDGRNKWEEGKGKPRDTDASTRNIRSVWTIPTRSFPGSHFAVMPPDLVEPCVKAGTSLAGCCPQCGKPWERVVEREHVDLKKPRERDQDSIHLAHGADGRAGCRKLCDNRTLGFRPACVCGCPEPGMRPDDWDLVATPTGEREGEDPSLLVGRAGYSRPRHPAEGSRPITRYEQRQYADQLKASPHKGSMAHEAGEAFAHYTRTDNSGARPIPPDLLARWLERGWLTSVVLPEYEPPEPSPCVVLDPFFGAGTVGLVCEQLGRDWIGIELNPEYAKLAQDRITAGGDLRAKMANEKQEAAGQLSMFDA